MRVVLALLLIACGSKEKAPPQPGSGSTVAAAEMELVNAQCRACHTLDYLEQQRLSEAAWVKTIDKMRRWGATLTDDQQMKLAAFAAKQWSADLPDREIPPPGPPPAGALPLAP